jgi:ferredoxin-NADP reductase
MKTHLVKVRSVDDVTHDVLRIVTEKPLNYIFKPGQATEISINKAGWKDEKRPFTFTCLPTEEYLEFTIKTYPTHKGVTNELLKLKSEDELILHQVFGTIAYRGEGTFIAGGAGVTPFISIFRDLHSRKQIGNNKLLFANKTKADIILEPEFNSLLGNNFINILSDENVEGCANGKIDGAFIKAHSNLENTFFYLCGPPPMMTAMEKALKDLHVNEKFIIKEVF